MRRNPSLILSAGKGCFTNCKGCYQYFGKNDIPTYDLIEFVKKYDKLLVGGIWCIIKVNYQKNNQKQHKYH